MHRRILAAIIWSPALQKPKKVTLQAAHSIAVLELEACGSHTPFALFNMYKVNGWHNIHLLFCASSLWDPGRRLTDRMLTPLLALQWTKGQKSVLLIAIGPLSWWDNPHKHTPKIQLLDVQLGICRIIAWPLPPKVAPHNWPDSLFPTIPPSWCTLSCHLHTHHTLPVWVSGYGPTHSCRDHPPPLECSVTWAILQMAWPFPVLMDIE